MAATVKLGAFEATIDGWNWTGENEGLVRMLNASLNPNGPSGSDPNPELHEAQRIAKVYGGKVIRWDKAEYVKDRIY